MRRILLLVSCCATVPMFSGKAYAAGMTAHIVVGQMAVKNKPTVLGVDLTQWDQSFRYGSDFPDVMMSYLQSVGVADYDELSHGEANGKPGGILNNFLSYYRNNCRNKTATADCNSFTAFFAGVLSHVLVDAAWH